MGAVQLQQVVGGADQRPFLPDFGDTAEQEPPKSPRYQNKSDWVGRVSSSIATDRMFVEDWPATFAAIDTFLRDSSVDERAPSNRSGP